MDTTETALIAALEIAGTEGFEAATPGAIAAKTGLPLRDLYDFFEPSGLLAAADRHFDRAMADAGPDADAAPRDRLFDIVMGRFEAMEDHRAGALAFRRAAQSDPFLLAASGLRRLKTARWALELAGLDDAGKEIRAVALAAIIERTEGAWSRDADGDFSRTMSALDRDLREAESFAEKVSRGFDLDDLFRKGPGQWGAWRKDDPDDDPAVRPIDP